MFLGLYATMPGGKGPLAALDVMHLYSPQSAILSALIPLALRGVSYRPLGAAAVLRRNVLIYGIGGLSPFVGIKVIDLILIGLRLV
jgi:K+-transporting ATPase ATPase B chain